MANILCVLYGDPVDGIRRHTRDDVPKIESYHGGQTAPTPEAIDFTRASCSKRVRRARSAEILENAGTHSS